MPPDEPELKPELWLLLLLQREAAAGRGLSLARLRQLSELPMSRLQRLLGRLEDGGLLQVLHRESAAAEVELDQAALQGLQASARPGAGGAGKA